LNDPAYQYWPVSSIALYALRNNILPLSLNTWYKYVHKLGIKRPRPQSRRKKSEVGIRAQRPHQLWHADITVFVTVDQIKHYIYCVVDNYSRKILSCRAYSSVKAELRRATIAEALKNVNSLIPSITLITEAEQNVSLDRNRLSLYIRQATLERKNYNRLHQCNNCKD